MISLVREVQNWLYSVPGGVRRRELEFLFFDEFGVRGGGGGGPLLLNTGGEPQRAMFSFICNFVDFSCVCLFVLVGSEVTTLTMA